MNYLEAQRYVGGYVDAIANTPDKGMARRESWLPCSKDRIVTAYKIFMAYVIRYKTLRTEIFDKYMMLLNMIDSFVSDDEAELIDDFYSLSNEEKTRFKENHPKEFEYCMDFALKMSMSDKHDEVVYFIQDVQKLDIDDPLWCEKVYGLANIEYKPEYKRYFNIPNYEKPISNVQKSSKSHPDIIDGPAGIGGWLILVILQVILASINLVTVLSENFKALVNSQLLNTLMTPGHPYYSPYWGFVLTLQTIFGICIGIYIIITAIFFFKASKKAIKLMIIFYILFFSYNALLILSNSLIPYAANNESVNSLGNLIGSILASLIWICYFLKSKRVRNTFVL